MQIPFSPFSYGRPGYGLAEARLVNMFPEPSPAQPAQQARIARPGMTLVRTVGVGPITGLFQASGAFGGDLFQVSGSGVYRGASLIGTVPLGTLASIAASDTQIVFVQGGEAWCYDGSTFEQVVIPDGKAVAAVLYIGARFYYLILDDDEWYFSAIDDATDVDGLAFATADSAPDASVNAQTLGDQVAFAGLQSFEFWTQTGDQDAPLVRSQGTRYDKGCIAPATLVRLDNRLFWLGSDLKVYATGNVPQRVSSHAIEALLAESANPELCSAFAVSTQGHDFLVLNIPDKGSFAYHIEQGDPEFAWAEWKSWGLDAFRCQCAVNVDGVTYLGDSLSGRVFAMSAEAYTDDGDPIEKVATLTSPRGLASSLELEGAVGIGPVDGDEPLVEMRYSDTRGRNWTDWQIRSLGQIGEYDIRVRWFRMGVIKNFRVFELRSTAAAPVVFSAVKLNEP